ncbi:MAG: helix-turn-helix domain-containing protein [Inquilinaceae bacterium]
MTDDVNKVTDGGDDRSDAERIAVALALNVGRLRRSRRLSLDALAKRSGVSKGLLVQIEASRSNPSIATLCRVAAALGVSVADLVEVGAQGAVRLVSPEEAARLWTGPCGGGAILLVGTTGPDMLELWRWEMHPGERHASEAHRSGTRELIHVTKGTLTLEVEGVAHTLKEGTSALAVTDRPHAYACAGARPVRFTMAVAEWEMRDAKPSRMS